MKEIKGDINRWRDIPCSWKINILKMTVPPNATYRFNAIPIKSPMAFFTEIEQKISQLIWTQKTLNIQSSLEKEEWSWKNQPSWLHIVLQSYSHQDSMVLAHKQKYRPTEQLMAFLLCFLTSPLLWSIKEPGVQILVRWLFWGASLLSSQSSGFQNKVVFLASTPSLLDSLACPAASRASLDLVIGMCLQIVKKCICSSIW